MIGLPQDLIGQAAGVIDFARLPLFYGEKGKDALTAELWVQRVNSAIAGAGWNAGQTMANVYAALRGRALMWYQFNRNRLGDDFVNWANFQQVFLEDFRAGRTATTSIALFDGLTQKANEEALDFALRVGRAADDLRDFTPALQVPDVIPGYPVILDGADLPVAAAIRVVYQLGIDRSKRHVEEAHAAMFFVAGLKREIRDKLLQIPNYQALDFSALLRNAQRLEREMKQPTTSGSTAVVAAVEEDLVEVNGVFYRRANPYHTKGRKPFTKTAKPQAKEGAEQKRFEGSCFNCGKKGHRRAECHSKPKQQPRQRVHAAETDEQEEQQGAVGQNPFVYEQEEVVGDGEVGFVGTVDYLN